MTGLPQSDRFYCPIPGFSEGHHYAVDPETGCWNWLLGKDRFGYGHGYVRGRQARAHRLAWVAAGRPLESGQPLHHICENPSCINPDHLELTDPSAHRRLHWELATSLTPEAIAEIKRLIGETMLQQQEIADRFGVSRETIVRIANGRAWAEEGDEIRKPVRSCRWCGETVGFERRRDAVFCCDDHRLKYNARKQTERRRAARQEVAA